MRRAGKRLPRGRRQELLTEIEAHLHEAIAPEATDAEALTVLDRLGGPEEIIEAEQPVRMAPWLGADGGVGIGANDDYRVPDLALHRPGAPTQWHPTAALVAEIISPGDETWEKLPFYAGHRVGELLIVDPQQRQAQWQAIEDGEYCPVKRSRVIDLGPDELMQRLDWPA